MIRALCPVCHTPQPLNPDGRVSGHRRKTESPLLRDKYGRLGTPCEGAGRLPLNRQATRGVDSQPPTSPQGDTSRRKEDATP